MQTVHGHFHTGALIGDIMAAFFNSEQGQVVEKVGHLNLCQLLEYFNNQLKLQLKLDNKILNISIL